MCVCVRMYAGIIFNHGPHLCDEQLAAPQTLSTWREKKTRRDRSAIRLHGRAGTGLLEREPALFRWPPINRIRRSGCDDQYSCIRLPRRIFLLVVS